MKIELDRSMCVAIVALALSLGCSTLDKGVDTGDFKFQTVTNPSADFNKVKTYAWAGAMNMIEDQQGLWEESDLDTDAELHFFVDRELRARGWLPVRKSPDVVVAYIAAARLQDPVLYEDKKGNMKFENLSKGALILELSDPIRREAWWRGAIAADLHQDMPLAQRDQRFDAAVHQLFSKLPRP